MLCLAAGCGQETSRDPKGDAVRETLAHIEGLGKTVTRLRNLTEIAPASQVALDLRMVAKDLGDWQRQYRSLRAKMLMRQVSQGQHREVNKRYEAAIRDVALKVDQTNRRLSLRSDAQFFIADLHRVQQIVRDLQ